MYRQFKMVLFILSPKSRFLETSYQLYSIHKMRVDLFLKYLILGINFNK